MSVVHALPTVPLHKPAHRRNLLSPLTSPSLQRKECERQHPNDQCIYLQRLPHSVLGRGDARPDLTGLPWQLYSPLLGVPLKFGSYSGAN